MGAICTVVISLEQQDNWYPTCGKLAVALGPLDLPVCQEHADLFEVHRG